MILELCMTDEHLHALNNNETVGYVAEGYDVKVNDMIAIYDNAGRPVRSAVVTWVMLTDNETHFGVEAWDSSKPGSAH